jgi:hypothetical protein
MSRFDRTPIVTFAARTRRWAAHRLARALAGTVVAATALLFGSAGALAAPATASGPTPEQMAAMTPAQQDAVLHPLNILANALDAVGRTGETANFAGLELNAQTGKVDLHLVNPGQSARFLAEAAQQDSTIDTSRVHVLPASHSRKQLDAARDHVIQSGAPTGYQITSVTVPTDGSGIEVGLQRASAGTTIATSDLPGLGSRLTATVGVPVTVVAGHSDAGALLSRYADGKPFIAGENITTSSGGGRECTSGVPAVGNSGGVYMVTAAHCVVFGASNTIYDGNGRFMGNVVGLDTHWDAAIYYVGSNARTDDNADEFDGPPSSIHFLPLRNTHYSFHNQFVCQDGFTSGVVCGIQVVNQDRTICYPGYACVRGVLGFRSAGTAALHGDSGALVFCVCEGSSPWREVRGGVTGMDPEQHPGDTRYMFWTESLDVYNRFHIHLNPNI